MALSKTGCSTSITKKDLDSSYKQGFIDGHNIANDNLKKKIENEIMKNKGNLVRIYALQWVLDFIK